MTYCPVGRTYQATDNQWGKIHWDFMSTRQARKYIEQVKPEPEERIRGRVRWRERQEIDRMWEETFKLIEDLPNRRQSHLSTLGVTKDDPQIIERTYRQKAVQHHPDHGGNAKGFSKVSIVYEALKRPKQEH